MGFKAHIQTSLDSGKLLDDESQHVLIDELSRLYDEIQAYGKTLPGSSTNGFAANLKKWFTTSKTVNAPQGVYIWGGVGRGKTYLMNLFYENAPTNFKWRVHFHRFMLWVHEQNGQLADEQDPLKHIARQVSAKNRLICLDEFMVTDIADAMILYRLLKHLTDQGVVIVTTANLKPDDLYQNGIQRDLFLPAIELIKQYCALVLVDSERDFRKQAWIGEKIYYSPLGMAAEAGLSNCHAQLTGLPEPRATQITIAGRELEAISISADVAWFDFKDLCQTYRSQKDYIQLSNQFSTLILSNVPKLGAQDDAAARRFINLIDTAYDYDVNLLMSAATPPDEIYTGIRLVQPFKRTASRLWEMSTPAYLSRERKTL